MYQNLEQYKSLNQTFCCTQSLYNHTNNKKVSSQNPEIFIFNISLSAQINLFLLAVGANTRSEVEVPGENYDSVYCQKQKFPRYNK